MDTEYERLYAVADDIEADMLEGLAVKAGILWKCGDPDADDRCGWVNFPSDAVCGGCGTLAPIMVRLAASDDPRDAEALRFHQALASGDKQVIEATRDEILDAVHTRIMNDDPAYREAGWTPR